MSSVSLPPGWVMGTDPASGRNYYIDTANGVTQWNPPPSMMPPPPPAPVYQPPPAQYQQPAPAQVYQPPPAQYQPPAAQYPGYYATPQPSYDASGLPKPARSKPIEYTRTVGDTNPVDVEKVEELLKRRSHFRQHSAFTEAEGVMRELNDMGVLVFDKEMKWFVQARTAKALAGGAQGGTAAAAAAVAANLGGVAALPPGWVAAADPASGRTY